METEFTYDWRLDGAVVPDWVDGLKDRRRSPGRSGGVPVAYREVRDIADRLQMMGSGSSFPVVVKRMTLAEVESAQIVSETDAYKAVSKRLGSLSKEARRQKLPIWFHRGLSDGTTEMEPVVIWAEATNVRPENHVVSR